jgi:3-hydroxyisobutyrate dehydrogenase-like beta-hydroxyacid dehydrogenase
MKPIQGIALIGFGEVGQILAQDLLSKGITKLAAFDPKFSNSETSPAKALKTIAVAPAETAKAAVEGTDLVISAVTAANTVAAAKSVVPGLRSGAFFLDLNSASPESKQTAAKIIEAAHGRYVEASVMAPVPPKRIASPLLLGGPHAHVFMEAVGHLGFQARVVSSAIGPAAATKMCRSVIVKGIEALLTESLLAARRFHVEDDVLASLHDLLPAGGWAQLAHYMIGRSVEHGARRAEEMREAAKTVSEAGIHPAMTQATVERQTWAAGHRGAVTAKSLPEMLDAMLQTSSR